MNEKKRRKPLASGILAIVLAISQVGCGVELVQVAVWLGQIVLYTAAMRATIVFVDKIIDNNQTAVGNAVEVDATDPHRGIIRSMRVGVVSRGTPTGELVTFEDVPVIRNSSGKWIVEKYYCDHVMAPRLSSSN